MSDTTPPPPPPAAPAGAAPLSEAEDKQWASFAHLGGILSFLPPLIIWLVFKERGYISDHWWARMQRLIDVMLERKHIDEEKHAEAIEKRPWFRRARTEIEEQDPLRIEADP